MHWLVGKLLMAMFGLGVIFVVVWATSGKMGDWPINGTVLLVCWLPLQVWHALMSSSLRQMEGISTIDESQHLIDSPPTQSTS